MNQPLTAKQQVHSPPSSYYTEAGQDLSQALAKAMTVYFAWKATGLLDTSVLTKA